MKSILASVSTMLLAAATLASPSAWADSPDSGSVLGVFDHLRILVHDISESRMVYRDRLGFVFPDPTPILFAEGSAHDISDMADSTYLELIAISDRSKLERVRPWIVEFLSAHEGAHSLGLRVSSAQAVSARLQARGVTAPLFKLARSNPLDPPVWLVTPEMPHLPAGAIFFVEYPPKRANGEPPTAAPAQRNTTEQLVSVWIVPLELSKAAEDLEALGLNSTRAVSSKALSAEGREFAIGSGRIVLLHATGEGPVAQFQRSRGEGVMGFTLSAADLKQARAIVEQGVKHVLNPYEGLYGTSYLIPGSAASGAWIEITQK
jgi:hypothetical protein